MALIRWQPAELTGLRRDMDRLFDSLWDNGGGDEPESSRPAVWRPSVDISETEEAYLVSADLPGIRREDIDVSVNNGRLTIKGERRVESEETKQNVHRRERAYGVFTRSFDLPTLVNAEGISATYNSGVLTLTIPKGEEAKPRQIEIKAGRN